MADGEFFLLYFQATGAAEMSEMKERKTARYMIKCGLLF